MHPPWYATAMCNHSKERFTTIQGGLQIFRGNCHTYSDGDPPDAQTIQGSLQIFRGNGFDGHCHWHADSAPPDA
eukprot:2087295-Amphidinium_carterae.1